MQVLFKSMGLNGIVVKNLQLYRNFCLTKVYDQSPIMQWLQLIK